jgi:hypothetical protein
MRHLGSIVLSLILAPAAYLLAGIGVVEAVGNASVAPHPDYAKVTLGVLAIGTAGLLYALLVLTRISPIGPVLAGLLYLTASVWALYSYTSLGRLLPDSVLGVHAAADAPLNGVALVLAVPLLLTVLSPRRWRRYAQPAAPAAATGAGPVGYPPPAGYNPSYPPPAGYQPGYPLPAQPTPQSPLDATRPLYPPPLTPPVMAPAPTSPAPMSPPVGAPPQPEPPVDPDAPTHRLGI